MQKYSSGHPHIIHLPNIGSADIGNLVVAEHANLPFEVKRAYWTFDVPFNKIRGHHAHLELEQLIVAMHGVLEMTIEDANRQRHTFILDNPSMALFIPRLCWREIRFEPGAMLLCLASMEYDEADYFRSYYEFVKFVESKG